MSEEERGLSDDPERALRFIMNNAVRFAQAKANRVYMEEYRKTLKAKKMKEFEDAYPSAAAQEREAYASNEYAGHLLALKEAHAIEEALRWKLIAAEAAIEVWRSKEASNRSLDRSGR